MWAAFRYSKYFLQLTKDDNNAIGAEAVW